jgi:muramoyltetrapeptide carboxypeptidase
MGAGLRPSLERPPRLEAGATLGVVAPSSPVPEERLQAGVTALECLGFRVVMGEHVRDRRGHLAGTDEARAGDLQRMFLRPDVDGIVCARGGSGSIRILPYLDSEALRAHPKVFIGYSDVTTVQLWLLRQCGLVTFFGPMVTPDFSKELSPACVSALLRQVSRPAPPGVLYDARDPRPVEVLVGGRAEGPCIGGTLALVAATLGTPHQIDLRGAIFFFEDVHESPARIERYLMQLRLGGLLDEVAGVLIGTAPYPETEEERGRYLSLEQVYADLLGPLGKPLLYNFPCGHEPDPITLPMGGRVFVDADARMVAVTEAVVV